VRTYEETIALLEALGVREMPGTLVPADPEDTSLYEGKPMLWTAPDGSEHVVPLAYWLDWSNQAAPVREWVPGPRPPEWRRILAKALRGIGLFVMIGVISISLILLLFLMGVLVGKILS
jgi:hypothetical protein